MIVMGEHNAFEDMPKDQVPGNLFETIQRQLETEDVDDSVDRALGALPPDEDTVKGIEKNIQKLKDQGLWATARFYERLLEKRDLQE